MGNQIVDEQWRLEGLNLCGSHAPTRLDCINRIAYTLGLVTADPLPHTFQEGARTEGQLPLEGGEANGLQEENAQSAHFEKAWAQVRPCKTAQTV